MRRDGRRVKSSDPEYVLTPHIMPKRNDALNLCRINIPLEPMQSYLNSKRKEKLNLSHLAIIIAAYVRVVAQYPLLNRFVVNKRIYTRNEFTVSMVVLKNEKLDNGTTSKVNFAPEDNLFEVNEKINRYIDENRNGEQDNSTDKLARFLISVPGLLRFGVNFLMWLDKHNMCPRAVIDASPFHTSLFISNLASIRTEPVFHHVYNFGTTGVFITIGKPEEIVKKGKDGQPVFEKVMPFCFEMDERICSGSYYAKALRQFKKYLANPAVLEEKLDADKVIREIPYRKDRYSDKKD